MKLPDHLWINPALMREILVEFCSKEKVILIFGSIQPGLAISFFRGTVKGAVDFYAINKSADVFKLVDSGVWINYSLPVRVGPACNTNEYLTCQEFKPSGFLFSHITLIT